MLVHAKDNRKKLIIGRGYCSCKHKDYIVGKGIVDSIIAAAIPFATNLESAINVGKTVVDVGKAGYDGYKIIKGIKDIVADTKEINKDRSEELKLLNDVK